MNNKLPLETLFSIQSKEIAMFPRASGDYFSQYTGLLQYLRQDIYTKIDAGLAANSVQKGYYTAHDAEHFNEVVRYAGTLLGVTPDMEVSRMSEWRLLNPYELYVLLVAIRIHDVGNINGRENHEKGCFTFLKNLGALGGTDQAEKKIIGSIAQAHGGLTSLGGKDTIGSLDLSYSIGCVTIRPRLLAGIVRLADELSENRARANNYALDHNANLPDHSRMYHIYANAISAARYNMEDKKFHIQYMIEHRNVIKSRECSSRTLPGGKSLHGNCIIKEMLGRLEKMDRERRYCNQYIRDVCRVDGIRANIEIVDENLDSIQQIAIPEMHDNTGYPDSKTPDLKGMLYEIYGEQFIEELHKKLMERA